MPEERKEKLKTFIQIVHPRAEERINNIYENYEKFEGFSPVMEITKNGFAVILVSCLSIAEDKVGAQNSGIFKTMKCDRVANSWGNLSAWSWGVVRF